MLSRNAYVIRFVVVIKRANPNPVGATNRMNYKPVGAVSNRTGGFKSL